MFVGEGESTHGARQCQLELPPVDSHKSSCVPGQTCCHGQTPPSPVNWQTSPVVPVSPSNLPLLRDKVIRTPREFCSATTTLFQALILSAHIL